MEKVGGREKGRKGKVWGLRGISLLANFNGRGGGNKKGSEKWTEMGGGRSQFRPEEEKSFPLLFPPPLFRVGHQARKALAQAAGLISQAREKELILLAFFRIDNADDRREKADIIRILSRRFTLLDFVLSLLRRKATNVRKMGSLSCLGIIIEMLIIKPS